MPVKRKDFSDFILNFAFRHNCPFVIQHLIDGHLIVN